MYVRRKAIKQLENLYGRPKEFNWEQAIHLDEMTMLQASQKNNRAHDFTFFIMNKEEIAVIRKHQHPPGFYRAPSGGSEPDEDIIKSIHREALEETGLKIGIDQYIMRIHVVFTYETTRVPWVSHIVTASPQTLILDPIDRKEIKEAKWVTWTELQGPIRSRLQSSPMGLFQYRVALTDAVEKILK